MHWRDGSNDAFKVISLRTIIAYYFISVCGSINKQTVAARSSITPTPEPAECVASRACCRDPRSSSSRLWRLTLLLLSRFIYIVQCSVAARVRFYFTVPRTVSLADTDCVRRSLSLLPFTAHRQSHQPRPCRRRRRSRIVTNHRRSTEDPSLLAHDVTPVARDFFRAHATSTPVCSSTCSSGTCWSCGTSSSDR